MTQIPEKAPKKKRHLVRKVILTLLAVLVLFTAGSIGYATLKAKYTTVYQGYNTRQGDLISTLEYDAPIRLIDSQSYTAKQDGKIRRLYVKAGDNVRDGDVLLALDNGTRVKAELDGRVNVIGFAEGESFKSGDKLIEVADFRHVKVTFSADEYDIVKLSRNQPVTVSIDSLKRVYQGKIDSINYEPTVNRNVSYYTATVYLDVDDDVYPGMKTKVAASQTLAENAVLVSRSALSFTDENQAYVYLQEPDGSMVTHEVTLGGHDDNTTAILEGIDAGTVVFAKVERKLTPAGIFGMMNQRMSTMQNNSQNNRNNRNNTNNRNYNNNYNNNNWNRN